MTTEIKAPQPAPAPAGHPAAMLLPEADKPPVPRSAVMVAQDVALEHRADHDYLPQDQAEALRWMPHAWVIDAMYAYRAQFKPKPPAEAMTDEDRTRALNLAYQFRSHPASRSIDDIEQAGEVILSLLAQTTGAAA